MFRPKSPVGMSAAGRAADVAALDCVEALEVLWTELAILDELCKVQGTSDPYLEAERLEPVWWVQRRALEQLSEARALLVGARSLVASRTGLSAERRAEVQRLMSDEEEVPDVEAE